MGWIENVEHLSHGGTIAVGARQCGSSIAMGVSQPVGMSDLVLVHEPPSTVMSLELEDMSGWLIPMVVLPSTAMSVKLLRMSG
jgi:hypothetical protein